MIRKLFTRSRSQENTALTDPPVLTYDGPCHLSDNSNDSRSRGVQKFEREVADKLRQLAVDNTILEDRDEFTNQLNTIIEGVSGRTVDHEFTSDEDDPDEDDSDYVNLSPNEPDADNSFEVDPLKRVVRFLLVGTDKGMYTCTGDHNLEHAALSIVVANDEFSEDIEFVSCVVGLIYDGRGVEVLQKIREYKNRLPRQGPLLMALATCTMISGHNDIVEEAYRLVYDVCSTPTSLFTFIGHTQSLINKRRLRFPPTPQNPSGRKRKMPQSNELNKRRKKTESDNPAPTNPAPYPRPPSKYPGWGRRRRKAIGSFYSKKTPHQLLYLLTKYKCRVGLTHRQILNYCHPKMTGDDADAKNLVLAYITRGYPGYLRKYSLLANPISGDVSNVVGYINGLEKIKSLSPKQEGDREKLLAYIRENTVCFGEETYIEPATSGFAYKDPSKFNLAVEHIPNTFYDCVEVWEELLVGMPLLCTLRHLGKMSKLKMFDKGNPKKSVNLQKVVSKFDNVELVKKSKIHPIQVLIGSMAYNSGKSLATHAPDVKRYVWRTVPEISTALNKLFWNAVKKGEELKTGKRFMISIDVSDSMTSGGCEGCPQLTPSEVAVAMALITWHVEESCRIAAFGKHGLEIHDLTSDLTKDMRIADAITLVKKCKSGNSMGDASRPMVYANEKRIKVDVFVIFTDNETWKGRYTPSDALKKYRSDRRMPKAKLIVCALRSREFSIADPHDPDMLDICGFDPEVPRLIKEFVLADN